MSFVLKTAIALTATLALLPAQADCPKQMWQCTAEQLAFYDKPDQTDRPVVIAFSGLGRLTFTPRVIDEYTNSRCSVEVRAGRSKTVVDTIGGKKPNSGSCGATSALGRVPGPANTFRVAIIHIANTRDLGPTLRAYYTPVIIYKTSRDPRWRVDAALSRELIAAGATDTIADIRKYLTATGK